MSKAHNTFMSQINLVDHLIHINRIAHKNNPEVDLNSPLFKGKYYALSQAVVVFSVAAWQAYVENVIKEVYDEVKQNANIRDSDEKFWIKKVFNLNFKSTESRIERFSTPDSGNVIKLFRDCLGFDPSPYWKWKSTHKKWKGKNVLQITNFWLKVRHASAHGSALPKDIRNGAGEGTIVNLDYFTLRDCKGHFRKLVMHTDKGITSYAESEFGVTLTTSSMTIIRRMRKRNEVGGTKRRLIRRRV